MEVKIKLNINNHNLWCTETKEKIELGEEYALVAEDYLQQTIWKPYKKEYIPIDEESWYDDEDVEVDCEED